MKSFCTKGQLKIIKAMKLAEDNDCYEDAEIVCSGLECWVGDHRTNWKIVNGLLRLCLLRDVSDTKGCLRFTLNEEGRAMADNPNYVPIITTVGINYNE